MKGILSFFLVLFLMPLGHGMMILMEHYLPPTPLHFAAFAMGFVGLLLAVRGVSPLVLCPTIWSTPRTGARSGEHHYHLCRRCVFDGDAHQWKTGA